MATVSDSNEPLTKLNCPVCFNQSISPRVLPCFHTLCERCLSARIDSEARGESHFSCPICKTATVPPDINVPIEKWVSTFPTNTLITALLKSYDVAEGNSDTCCEPCKLEEKTTEAQFWCVDCKEKLCNSCQQYHKRMKLLRDHRVLKLAEVKDTKQSPNRLAFDDNCVLHPGKAMEVFCVNHRKLCCIVCFASSHRDCNEVHSIDDIADERSKNLDYATIITDLGAIQNEMKKLLFEKSNNITELSQELEKILHDMDTMIDQSIGKLNDFRKKFREESQRLHSDKTTTLSESKENIQGFKTNLKNFLALLEAVQFDTSPRHKFMTYEIIRTQIMSHYQQLKSFLTEDVEIHFKLSPNKIVGDLENWLPAVGDVNVSSNAPTNWKTHLTTIDKKIDHLDGRTNVGMTKCAAQVEKSDLITSQVTFVKAVTRDELGSQTFFMGCTNLANSRLIMADYYNNRLVELDGEYNVVKEYKIDGSPIDVAAGNNDNEIYIAVNRKYIYKCTLHNDLTIVSRIKAPSSTCGITVIGNNIVVDCDYAVELIAQDGSLVKSIAKSGLWRYVAVSQTQRTIYHTDKNDIVCRMWEGQEIFRYQHEQMNEPRGIDLDRNKNSYVCGMDSYNVHQVSANGQRSRIILEKLQKISKPYSVIFHPHRNEFLVTSWNEDTVFEVYKLQ